MTSDKVTPDHLRRRAIVYVRQSTVIQVLHNLESLRRQYNLAEYARELGFTNVVTIDEDLGRSGSGLVERPGFQRLVAEFVPAKQAPSCPLKLRGWREMVGIGII